MTDHPLTETAAAKMWDASPCSEGYEFRGMLTVEQDATMYAMRAAFDAGREHERTNPTADADRPWEPLNGRKPRVGDEVRQDYCGATTTAVAGRVDDDGSPWTAEGRFIGRARVGTWYVRRAATPPAVGVELPGEFGDVILNPRWGARSYARAVHLGEGVWAAEVTPGADVYTHLAHDLAAFTLPDGTRTRRDGKHGDGRPWFVKVPDEGAEK